MTPVYVRHQNWPTRLLGTLALTLSLSGCLTSVEPDVSLTDSPAEDSDYKQALAKATQERTVIKNFETRYAVTATYLSPEFRGAFAKRLEHVYKEGEVVFAEASTKAGFFISIRTSGTNERADLNNPQHWTVLMTSKEGPLKPVFIKKIGDKERWRAFFGSVNDWTTEYLVVFDAPSVNANSPDLVEKPTVNLLLANADAQVNLTW